MFLPAACFSQSYFRIDHDVGGCPVKGGNFKVQQMNINITLSAAGPVFVLRIRLSAKALIHSDLLVNINEGSPAFLDIMKMALLHHHLMIKNEKLTTITDHSKPKILRSDVDCKMCFLDRQLEKHVLLNG